MAINFIKKGIDTSDANATVTDIVENKTAYVNGEKITGNLPSTHTYSAEADVTNNTEDSQIDLTVTNATRQVIDTQATIKLHTPYNDVATAIGLTADKLTNGDTILGVVGTATVPSLTIPQDEYGLENATSGELDNDTGVKFFTNANTQSKLYEEGSIAEIHVSNELLADTINLSSDDLVEGSSIIGIDGTATELKGQTKSVAPTTSSQIITPDTDYNGLTQVSVSAVDNTIDSNIQASNIKKDVTILGVTGTVEEGVDINDYFINKAYYSPFTIAMSIKAIPMIDTEFVTNMTRMFSGCREITTIPQLNTSEVTNMSYMFSSCMNLTTIPQLNTSKVTNMSYMFSGCMNLTTIPQLDTSKVTDMSDMFDNCYKLTTIPQLDTSKVTDMNWMFYGCMQLTTIPQLNMSSATDLNNMFGNCNSLSDESLNNILASLLTATSYTDTKTLAEIGLSETQATKCTTLSNWAACEAAGWTTGY